MEKLESKIAELLEAIQTNSELVDQLLSDSKAKHIELRKLEKLKAQLDEVLSDETAVPV